MFKNDPDDLNIIKEALKSSPGFLRNIVCFKINWNPKSENILEISKTLNIGLNSIAFFDDSAFERNEVTARLPHVKVFTDQDLAYFYKLPIFQQLGKVTDTGKNRIAMYQTEFKRQEEYESKNMTFEEFLYESDLQISFKTVNERISGADVGVGVVDSGILDRVVEILSRTNQLNVTLKRTDRNQVEKYYQSKDHVIQLVSMRDKYGDYGIIGVYIIEIGQYSSEIIEFALSCRGMGRKIENALLVNLLLHVNANADVDVDSNADLATDIRARTIKINVSETNKNQNLITVLKSYGFVKTTDSQLVLTFSTDIINLFKYPGWFRIN